MKFEKIQPGMILYDRHKERAGNTTLHRLGEWQVVILSVDADSRSAMVSWNGNQPAKMWERNLTKLKTWSMYDDCAEVTEGMVGTYSVKLKRGHKVPAPKMVETKP